MASSFDLFARGAKTDGGEDVHAGLPFSSLCQYLKLHDIHLEQQRTDVMHDKVQPPLSLVHGSALRLTTFVLSC